MAIRKDDRKEMDLNVGHLVSPEDIRDFLLKKWSEEERGVKYRYFVEKFSGQSGDGLNNEDAKRIYLERPARLNKGCDFVIYIEDFFIYKNGKDKPPSHKDLHEDLRAKRQELSVECMDALKCAIENIYHVRMPEFPIKFQEEIRAYASEKGRDENSSAVAGAMTDEYIFVLCKWFFIEQDLTYWNGEARDMLWNSLQGIWQVT